MIKYILGLLSGFLLSFFYPPAFEIKEKVSMKIATVFEQESPHETIDKMPGADGYAFTTPAKFDNKNLKTTIVQYDTLDQLRKIYKEHPLSDEEKANNIMAFTEEGSNECTVHIISPFISYEPEYIGHELLHCIYGNFHEDQD